MAPSGWEGAIFMSDIQPDSLRAESALPPATTGIAVALLAFASLRGGFRHNRFGRCCR